VASLPERLRMVVELYYGKELSLKEIGARMGITESRACQLRGEAVAELQTLLLN